MQATAESIGQQQSELARQGEVLLKVVEATDQVARLEETLNRNLQSLAGAKNFEETVVSLAAAIQLLSSRAGPFAVGRQPARSSCHVPRTWCRRHETPARNHRACDLALSVSRRAVVYDGSADRCARGAQSTIATCRRPRWRRRTGHRSPAPTTSCQAEEELATRVHLPGSSGTCASRATKLRSIWIMHGCG